jgi:hypothetical protein
MPFGSLHTPLQPKRSRSTSRSRNFAPNPEPQYDAFQYQQPPSYHIETPPYKHAFKSKNIPSPAPPYHVIDARYPGPKIAPLLSTRRDSVEGYIPIPIPRKPAVDLRYPGTKISRHDSNPRYIPTPVPRNHAGNHQYSSPRNSAVPISLPSIGSEYTPIGSKPSQSPPTRVASSNPHSDAQRVVDKRGTAGNHQNICKLALSCTNLSIKVNFRDNQLTVISSLSATLCGNRARDRYRAPT